MRRAALLQHVTELVASTWTGPDVDVAAAVVVDEDAFGALAHRLDAASDGTEYGVTCAWERLVAGVSDATLDWLADRADSPARFLASRV